MKLTAGKPAIEFEAKDIHGTSFKLTDFKGKKIYLGFFRNVNCPFCNLRVHQLRKLYSESQKNGVEFVFLFESANNILKRSIFHQEISPIPLIGDPEKVIYKKYGVEASTIKMLKTFLNPSNFAQLKEGKKLQGIPTEKDKDATFNLIPADFLIDEDFMIVKAHYGQHVNDHIDLNEVKRFAKIIT